MLVGDFETRHVRLEVGDDGFTLLRGDGDAGLAFGTRLRLAGLAALVGVADGLDEGFDIAETVGGGQTTQGGEAFGGVGFTHLVELGFEAGDFGELGGGEDSGLGGLFHMFWI